MRGGLSKRTIERPHTSTPSACSGSSNARRDADRRRLRRFRRDAHRDARERTRRASSRGSKNHHPSSAERTNPTRTRRRVRRGGVDRADDLDGDPGDGLARVQAGAARLNRRGMHGQGAGFVRGCSSQVFARGVHRGAPGSGVDAGRVRLLWEKPSREDFVRGQRGRDEL